MIFSRTARKEDIELLEIQDLINTYASLEKNAEEYSFGLYKFWDYALVLRLLSNRPKKLLNIVTKGDDVTFNIICNHTNIKYEYTDIESLLSLPIRTHKYDIVTCLGSLEHSIKNVRVYLDKLYRHINLNGYIVITTDEQNISKYKTKNISISDLLDFSLFFEHVGFEFVSDDNNLLVEYDEQIKNVPHSLVMKRIGL